MSIIGAAQSLVKNLNDLAAKTVGPKAAPMTHSVYIHHDTEKEKQVICVAINPGFPHEIPNEFMGYPIEIVEWPKGL